MAAVLIASLALIGIAADIGTSAGIAAAPTPAAPARTECNRPAPILVGNAPAGPRRLDRLPAASHYLTLHRTIDGCLSPIIVRADITGTKPDR